MAEFRGPSSRGDARAPVTIARVLGQDDWLFYARTTDGTLVFYSSELDWHWLETPNGGQPVGIEEYDAYERSGRARVDQSWMHRYVVTNANSLYWEECGVDPVSGEYLGWGPAEDDKFTAQSRAHYLAIDAGRAAQ